MHFLRTTLILFFAAVFCASTAQAQTFPAPRREKLLNGLKMLIWTDPQSPKVTVKLRIHSGAAFDPKDKMGTMALVGDILFPSEQTKEFFSEDLQGSLNVESNYDYIQITATGKAEEIQTMLETMATALTNPQITPENVKIVRDARLEKLGSLKKIRRLLLTVPSPNDCSEIFPTAEARKERRKASQKLTVPICCLPTTDFLLPTRDACHQRQRKCRFDLPASAVNFSARGKKPKQKFPRRFVCLTRRIRQNSGLKFLMPKKLMFAWQLSPFPVTAKIFMLLKL